jgi:fructose-specific component phosphotransferase system IIB-like protein
VIETLVLGNVNVTQVAKEDQFVCCGGSSLSNQFNGKVYWAIHSSQAISNSDRLIIEGIT